MPRPLKKKRIPERKPKRDGSNFKLKKNRAKKRALREKPVLKPSDLRKRKRLKKRNRIIIKVSLVIFLILGVIIGIWFFGHTERLTIQTIDVRSEGSVPDTDIETAIFETLKANPRHLFPRTNTFFVPINKLEQTLTKKFLRIKSANILRKGFTEIIVVIEERSPAFIYCEDNESLSSPRYSGDCFFADSDGVVYSTAPYIPRSEFQIIYFNPEKTSTILGTTPLSKEELKALAFLGETLKSKDVGFGHVHLLDDSAFEVETDKTYSLIVAVKDDYTDELERFFSALDADVFDEGHSLKDVYQFDLRFGRKVFYKYFE